MRFLVVEDVCMVRKLLQKLLLPIADCVCVENGKEALIQYNHAMLSENRFDAIFLDIMMPEVSGDVVLKEIRAMEKKWEIEPENQTKIIVVSSLNDWNNVVSILKNHCDAYITKPFDRQTVFETLTHLGLYQPESVLNK